MIAFDDMRGFIQLLKSKDQLKEIDIELNVARGTTELQPLMRFIHNSNGPALMLNNLSGYNCPDIPVLFNPYGTRERTSMILGKEDPLEGKLRHAEVLTDKSLWHKPRKIEMDFAGGLRGAPVDVVDCETIDIAVPATAEWILEGKFLPDQDVTIGPHSNPVGYYDDAQFFPLIEIQSITHRKNPIWYSTMEMEPPFDHNYMACMPIEGELLSDLQAKIPEVQDVVVTPNLSYFVQLSVDGAQKPHSEFGKFVLQSVWDASGRWGKTAKIVVVVGPDVNPYDLSEVEWAINTRVQPYTDSIINKSGHAFLMDPSAEKDPGHGIALQSEQIGFDATIKIPERFQSYPEYSNADAEDVEAIAEKFKGLL